MPEQPDDERPDSGADMASALQLDPEETLTDGDPLDAGYSPPDRPYGVEDPAVTPAGEREGESLDARLRREEPEEETVDQDRTGRLVAGVEGGVDGVAEDVGVDGGAATAEEAAVHDVERGFEPVADDSPAEDPEVAQALEEERRPAAAQEDAERDYESETEPQEPVQERRAAARIDSDPETGGIPGVDGGRDAGVTPGSWR
ncbi:DUF5709 domain-containing protein [Pseudonocardia pini]|uniref:DUF5709 domain-containing protein n=1 Tax=Pseudonocardia pini TaxID=2758030 RepID=UPI0015F110AD|nr:DUF5709 domain-containing protein [Pseudonocardia pini]